MTWLDCLALFLGYAVLGILAIDLVVLVVYLVRGAIRR